MPRIINASGLALIKEFEGFRQVPYQDSSGVWTIGYGHTKNVKKDTFAITETQAEAFLMEDLSDAEGRVAEYVNISLTGNQYSALVSLIYNVGVAPLTHTLGAKLNAGDIAGAANEFLRWNYADGEISEGLTRRRMAERALFLTA